MARKSKAIPRRKNKAVPWRYRHETGVIMTIDILRYVMNIFYGPFLTMYFFKISLDSVGPISIYNMIAHAIVGIAPVMLGIIIKERHQLATFRTGVILNFVYILYILIAREQIVEHLGVLALG